jgi:excisionase family DNA binding protein
MAKKKTYTPMPALPPDLAARYQAMLAVLMGELTVSEAARRLGLSRNHFQSLTHRALGSLIEELGAHKSGRRARTPEEKRLREEAERLHRENERLRQKVETTDRILKVASGLLKGRLGHGTRRDPRSKVPETSAEEG